MANFQYKKHTQTTMKLVGTLNTDAGIITVDFEDKNLMTVLSDFNGMEVTINVKTAEDEELFAPEDETEDEEFE